MADEKGKPEKPSLPSDEDIAARFERIREELKGIKMPELPDDEALRARVQQATSPSTSAPRMPEVPDVDIKRPDQNDKSGAYNYRSLGIGMSAAYSLLGSMILGFGLGWAYDHFTHNTYGQPIGAVLGSILGIVAAMFMINSDGRRK